MERICKLIILVCLQSIFIDTIWTDDHVLISPNETVPAATSSRIDCNRTLVGRVGVVSSYNFPFNYVNNLQCVYTHYFKEFEEHVTKVICLKFTRFRLEDTIYDYLEINGNKFQNRGNESLANLCYTVVDNKFVMNFVTSNYMKTNEGFYAKYFIEANDNVAKAQSGNEAHTEDGGEATKFCPSEFTCLDGKKCVDYKDKCNNVDDCDDGSDEAYATARCIGERGQTRFRAADFNSRSLDNYRIKVITGLWEPKLTYDNEDYGPRYPHGSGYFIQSDFDQTAYDRTTATLAYTLDEDQYDHGIAYCLTFWYHMFGKDSGRLDVLWGNRRNLPVVWTRVGNLGNKWYKGEIQRISNSTDLGEIHFNVTRGGTTQAAISLDDISLMPGPCHLNKDFELADDLSCTFEDGMCRWSDEKDWVVTDQVGQDNGPPVAAQGKFYLRAKHSRNQLTSPMVTSHQDPRCMIFHVFSWYGGNILVSIQFQDGSSQTLGDYFISGKPTWQINKVTIKEQQPYRVIFKPRSGLFHFDDIAYVENSCLDLDYMKCDFDQYMCNDSIGGSDGNCISKNLTCDGHKDCPSGDDEENCLTCQGNAFLCLNHQCVPRSGYCDGVMQCDDGSDENYCPEGSYRFNFPLEAVVCIIIALCIILGLLTVKLASLVYKRRGQQATNRANALRQYVRDNAGNDDGTFDVHLTQPPPNYEDVVDNPAFPIPDHTAAALHDDKDDLPSYDIVRSENFVQITVPVEEEIEKMKRDMAAAREARANCLSSESSLSNNTDDHHSVSSDSTYSATSEMYTNPAYIPDESHI